MLRRGPRRSWRRRGGGVAEAWRRRGETWTPALELPVTWRRGAVCFEIRGRVMTGNGGMVLRKTVGHLYVIW
jgi:hypothetical protein